MRKNPNYLPRPFALFYSLRCIAPETQVFYATFESHDAVRSYLCFRSFVGQNKQVQYNFSRRHYPLHQRRRSKEEPAIAFRFLKSGYSAAIGVSTVITLEIRRLRL